MSSQPATMPEAASAAEAALLYRGLPDEIVIWEILVRLPPKSLLRCRAVCWAWRRATSARHFLLAHHDRQPTLPLLHGYNCVGGVVNSIDIVPFDYRAGLIAAADQLQSIARLRYDHPTLGRNVSCDGLLVLTLCGSRLSICNPATRQYAPLQQLHGYMLLWMYPHKPTGEHRLLLYPTPRWVYADPLDAQDGSYVFTLGSGQPPRYIGFPDTDELLYNEVAVLFRGNLHWNIGHKLMVFDTIAESFHDMRSPIFSGYANMFEIGGLLGISTLNDEATVLDIWMMEDYEGKLVASFHHTSLGPTHLRLKESLVSHTFFPTLEGYLVNALPFI